MASTSRADLDAAAEGLWAVLAEIDAGRLTCSAAQRNRLQGAAVALQALAHGDQGDTADSEDTTG